MGEVVSRDAVTNRGPMRTPTTRPMIGRLAGVAILIFLVASPVATTSCSDDSTGPDPCSLVSLSSSGNLTLDIECSGGFSATISNIQYDQYGRRSSYNFDIGCSDGSNRHTGSVSNIQYNQYGQAQSATVRIDGETCSVSAG